ncbi:hypothetical protein LA080_013011 [Diaporthe eres]|nr:hypothetical protein LA080_013011 [Diaporthe eres]
MQLTSILSAAILPLLAFAQDTTSGTTTLTQTSTMTKTVTLASNTVTMTATNNSTTEPTSVTRTSSRATATATATSSKTQSSETPGVNGLGNGAASLGSSHVAIAGVAGMLVVALIITPGHSSVVTKQQFTQMLTERRHTEMYPLPDYSVDLHLERIDCAFNIRDYVIQPQYFRRHQASG